MRPAIHLFVLSLLACGSGDDAPPPGDTADAGSSADAAASSENALGQTCADSNACPTDPPHQCVFLESGNPDLGYCSPICSTDADCREGYTGPSGGEPTCFVPNMPDACSILCDGQPDCPTGLECKITGGPVNVCATP